MGTTNKGFIAKEDMKIWDGINATFTRKTSSGGTASYDVFDWVGLDVSAAYGTRDDAAITSAITQTTGSDNVMFFLSVGTWTISNTITIPANVTLKVPPGAVLTDDASNADLTINGPLEAGLYQIFDWGNGSGSVTFGNLVRIAYPEWWGIDGTADEVQINLAIQALSSGAVILDNNYTTAAAIVPKSHVDIKGNGKITLANGSDCFMVSLATAMTNITIEGLEFDGNGTNQSGDDTSIIHSSAASSEIVIKNNTFRNALYNAIHHHEDTTDTGIDGLQIVGNRMYDFYNSGIGIFDSDRVIISDNIIDNSSITPTDDGNGIGMHACTNSVVSNNSINLSSGATVLSAGIGVGTASTSAGNNSSNITITGNTIDGNSGTFINAITIPGVAGTVVSNLVISNNTIKNCKNDGGMGSIELATNVENTTIKGNLIDGTVIGIALNSGTGQMTGIIIEGNLIDTFTKAGIKISGNTTTDITNITVSNNIIKNGTGANGNAGITFNGPGSNIAIKGNTIKSNVNGEGIRVNANGASYAISELSIIGNISTDNTYGLFWFGSNFDNLIVTENIFVDNSTTIANYTGTNMISKNNIGYYDSAVITTLTDAASIGIRSYQDVLFIPGPTALTAINNGKPGAIIKLIATGNVTITDNAAISLAGAINYAMTADDTLTLVCKSTDVWVELARSVN